MKPLYVRVKNWDRFQHYKSRENAPNWIKVKPDLLLDYEFQKLSEAERYRLIAIWLLAGKLHNRLPFDDKFIAKSIDVKKVDLSKYVRLGWLELHDEEGTPVSIESLDGVYTEARESLALGEQSRKAGYKGRRADEDSGVDDSVGEVIVLSAAAEIDNELDRMLDKLAGVDERSRRVLLPLARQLDVPTIARLRQSAQEGGKGVGWVVKAFKGEIAERSAA